MGASAVQLYLTDKFKAPGERQQNWSMAQPSSRHMLEYCGRCNEPATRSALP